MPLTNAENCVEDRIRNPGGLDQVFLGHLRPEVTTRKKAIGADNRQRNVMSQASGRFRDKEVTPCRLEELKTALSSNDGELATSTTPCAPASTPASPSPVRTLTPEEGDAATT